MMMAHAHYENFAAVKIREARIARTCRKVGRQFRLGEITEREAVAELRDIGCFETEISEALAA